MAIDSRVIDSKTGNNARVSKYGQLITAPLSYSSTSSVKMEVINTAYNYVLPRTGHKIVITDILLYANKSVGATDATVTVYTASSLTSTVVETTILQTEMLKNTSRDLIGLNLLIEEEGVWVNGKTDDDDIYCTIMYYYVPKEDI